MELLEHVLQASHAAAAAKYRRTDASLMPRRRPLPLRLQPAMTSSPALVCAAVETVRRRRARLVVVAGSTLSDE